MSITRATMTEEEREAYPVPTPLGLARMTAHLNRFLEEAAMHEAEVSAYEAGLLAGDFRGWCCRSEVQDAIERHSRLAKYHFGQAMDCDQFLTTGVI